MVLVKVCLVEELPPGSMRNFSIQDRAVLVANLDGRYYAVDGICSHQFANLSLGTRDGFIITCPRHRMMFDLRDGRVVQNLDPPERVNPLRTYSVKLAEGCLNVEI